MKPKISIIIPVHAINDYIRESIPRILALADDNFDIIVHVDLPTKEKWPRTKVIVGKFPNETPPVKREEAIAYSDAGIIAFMDDDAFPRHDWLQNARRHFAHPDIGAIYGPGVTPASDGLWAKVSGEVLSSPLTSWKYTYRYIPAGKYFRETNKLDCQRCRNFKGCPAVEKIFTVDDAPTVNLLMRREVFDRAGGFDTKYWPGEDTKLCLDVVKKQHRKIVYDPDVFVWHHRRNSFLKHFQQNCRYARHRGFFAKRFPETSLRWQYFIPSLFVIFLMFSIYTWIVPINTLALAWIIRMLWATYAALLIIAGIESGHRQHRVTVGLLVIPMIFLTHVMYGIFFIVGLLSPDLKR